MKYPQIIAIRLCRLSRSLAASFLAALLAVTGWVFVSSPVYASSTACTGTNMVVGLEKSNPALLADIKADAGRTENGAGIFWKIEKSGVPDSWLFGTMHFSDPRITRLPAPVQSAFNQARTVVLETTDIIDESKAAIAIARKPEYMMLTDGTNLTDRLTPAEAQTLNRMLAERSMQSMLALRMRPWVISAAIMMSSCDIERKNNGVPMLDEMIGKNALAKGKKLVGLETIESQMEAINAVPLHIHVDSLKDTLRLGDRLPDVIETMKMLYLRGDVAMIWPFLRKALPNSSADGYVEVEKTLVVARNRTMMQAARPIVGTGGAFIAVGALHLPGPEGLVALLRKEGYKVTRVSM